MTECIFEEMREEYLDAVMVIYNHYVLHSTATFHAHAMTPEEMKDLVYFSKPIYRTFVMLREGNVCGYVSLKQHKPREAYNGTAEVTTYLRPDCVGRGLGSQGIRYIERFAKFQGIHVLIATICGENEQSIGLFSKNGYSRCAHYREVGRKLGQLLDVVAYQKILDP